MLTDQGLATEKEIKTLNKFLSERTKGIINGDSKGCIGTLICKGCKHKISDSFCLCAGYFKCPNCGIENGNQLQIIGTFEEGKAVMDKRVYLKLMSEKPKKDYNIIE